MRSQLPFLRLRPDRLIDDLAVILSSQAQWPEQGRQARRFVERWHDPVTIARAMIACYQDEASHFDLAAASDRPVPSTDALSLI
jgi:hypothetical protein